jgi:hypothetical protein
MSATETARDPATSINAHQTALCFGDYACGGNGMDTEPGDKLQLAAPVAVKWPGKRQQQPQ